MSTLLSRQAFHQQCGGRRPTTFRRQQKWSPNPGSEGRDAPVPAPMAKRDPYWAERSSSRPGAESVNLAASHLPSVPAIPSAGLLLTFSQGTSSENPPPPRTCWMHPPGAGGRGGGPVPPHRPYLFSPRVEGPLGTGSGKWLSNCRSLTSSGW